MLNEVNNSFDAPTYLELFANEGYECFYYGKWHVEPDTPITKFQCEGFSQPEYGNPYNSEEYNAYLDKFNLPPFEVRIRHSFLNPEWPRTEELGIK